MTWGSKLTIVIASIVIASGFAAAGFFVGQALLEQQRSNRYVTVKGLSESEVTSDLAIWTLRFNATGSNLAEVNKKIESDRAAIIKFLTDASFTAEEWEQGQLKVTDLLAREYRQDNSSQNRYILESSLVLRTKNVEAARKAAEKVSILVQGAVVLVDNRGPVYRFTKLNEIKPQLIAEATKNARAAAEQFAKDSGSIVDGIRNANQGSISFSERDGGVMSEAEYGAIPADSSITKKMRVVATVEYYLR